MVFRSKHLALKIVIQLATAGLIVLLYGYDFESVFSASPYRMAVIQLVRIAAVLFFLVFLLHAYGKMQLYTKILLGLVLGAGAGLMLGLPIGEMKPIGDAFIRLISLVVVPLVFASLVVGTASLNDVRKLGRIGGKTLGFYLVTTSIAITIGLILANGIQPGKGLDDQAREELLQNYHSEAQVNISKAKEKPSVADTLLDIIPKNPIRSLADGKMLQIIFFALLFGVALTFLPENKAGPVIGFFDGLNEAMIQIVHFIMILAPYGVFALIAHIVGQYGTGILWTLIKYSSVVVLGLVIHAGAIYPLAVKLLSKISIKRFFAGIRPAQLIAFSSSSSSATLPLTMECVEKNLGVSSKVSSFVLPLGATINMDGTALYQGVAAVFIAQVYGLDLTLIDQLTIILTATLASVGAAGVPGVGMITLALVLESIQIPLEGIALILGVDRLVDMCRTVVNVTGDASAATIIAASEGELASPR